MSTTRIVREFGQTRWRIRLTLWLAAAFAGLAVVGFTHLADFALGSFRTLRQSWPWLPFVLTPAIGMIVVWATQRWFAGTRGSGIPQVIAATRLATHNKPIGHLLSLRIAAAKVGLGSLALLGGFSAGREGPSVQVAASIVHGVHRYLPHARLIRPADLMVAGGAAGIAAAFNTPLAGIVFAGEELARHVETRTSGVLIGTIIIAGLVAIAIQGNFTYFGQLRVTDLDSRILIPVVGSGIICGVLGGLFSYILLLPQRNRDWAIWRWRAKHPVRFAGLCGIYVALFGWFGGGFSFGSGYDVTEQAIQGTIVLPWYVVITRFLATLATYFSGIPGGIFAPSLAIGASLGFDIAPLFAYKVGAHPIVALCMAGFLAAATRSPITAAIIVMEMVDGHGMVISLMAVALIASAISSRFGGELYHRLALDFLRPAKETEQDSQPAVTDVPDVPDTDTQIAENSGTKP